MNFQQKLELHRKFWRGELERPLLGFFITDEHPAADLPRGPKMPSSDTNNPMDIVVARARASALRQNAEPGDRVPEVSVNDCGTAFLPALAGADYRDDGHTVWCIPTGRNCAELKIRPFDPANPLWCSYAEKLRAVAEADIENAVAATAARTGPMEALLDMVGAAQLSLDMFDRPNAVKDRACELLQLWKNVFEAQWEILGQPHGINGFGVYLPGKSSLFTEDALAIVGPRQFDEFFREPISAIARHLETAFIHTHSAGLDCCRKLAEIDALDGVELSNDPNGPSLEEIVEVGVALQEAGKSVMFSNWKHPLTDEEVRTILDRADPTRTHITLTVGTVAEAERWLAEVRERFGTDW
ncbi:MAG: hypothetical protein R6X33_18965 [Candidatus Brocadiia bacterium]